MNYNFFAHVLKWNGDISENVLFEVIPLANIFHFLVIIVYNICYTAHLI